MSIHNMNQQQMSQAYLREACAVNNSNNFGVHLWYFLTFGGQKNQRHYYEHLNSSVSSFINEAHI